MDSTDDHDALLKEAIELLDQRQTNTRTDSPELDTRFFNALLLCLLESTAVHWWCSPQLLPLATESFWLFSLYDVPYILKYKKKLNGMLQNCQQCVKYYYKAKQGIRTRYLNRYPPGIVNRLFNILEDFDQSRLKTSTTLSIDQKCCAITEFICFPYYRLQHEELFDTLFDTIETAGQYPTLEYLELQNCALLAFHSQRPPRVWACQLLEKFADENTTSNQLNQENIDGLLSLARQALDYFGSQLSYDDSFEFQLPKYGSDRQSFTLPVVQNNTNIWKGLRHIFNLLPDTTLETLITSSSTPMFDLLTQQLQCAPSDINMSGLLKTMALLWKRLGDRFWGDEMIQHVDVTTFHTLLRRICDHQAYLMWTAFAQQDKATIRADDGTMDSGKKLIRGVQDMVDWVFDFWCSLSKMNGVDYLTNKVLDMLLSYFQLSSWTPLFRSCSASVAFRVIQHTITENTGIPVESINHFADVWVPFAMDDDNQDGDNAQVMPTPVSILQLTRDSATSILTDLLYQDSRMLRDTYITLARNSSTSGSGGGTSMASNQQNTLSFVYPKVWNFLQSQLPTGTANILSLLMSIYAPLVSIDTILQQTHIENKSLYPGRTPPLDRITTLRDMTVDSLILQYDGPWKIRKAVMRNPSMAVSLVSILAYSTTKIREMTCILMTKHKQKSSRSPSSSLSLSSYLVDAPLRFLFDRQPQLAMAAMTQVLTDFMELSNVHAEVHILATTLGQVLESTTTILLDSELGYLSELVKADNTDKEQQTIVEYWNVLWQVISTVLIDSYRWSKTGNLDDILGMVTLWMNIATETIVCYHLLQKLAGDDLLAMYSLVSTVNGLTSWVDASQRPLLVKLVPLMEMLLHQLQSSKIKLPRDVYDQLKSVVTSLDTTMLEQSEKDLILRALRSHEPEKLVVVLDNSDDDEYMEWDTLPLEGKSTNATTTVPTPIVLSDSDARQINAKTTTGQQSTSRNTSPSDSDSDSDSDSESDLFGLVEIANKKRKLDHQIQSLDQQQRRQEKNESMNSADVSNGLQTQQPPTPMKPVDSTQQFIQHRVRIRQEEHERKMKKDPNIDQLYKTVFSWSLENVKPDTPPPHISSIHALNHIQDTYSGYQEYYDVFEPLLLLEIWSQFIHAKDTLTASDVMEGFTMVSRCHINDFVDITFNVPLSIKVNLAVDDLVCMASHFGPDFFFTRMIRGAAVAASESLQGRQWHDRAFLGKVMSVAKVKNTGDIVVRGYFPQERITILNSLAPKSTWKCLKVTSLMMVQREYAALLGLRYYDLANDLLHPHPTPMPTLCSQDVQNCAAKYGLNETQATAILGVLNKPMGFTLIQGPPGTGKTKTILALLNELLSERQQQETKNPGGGKILVCAPSNAAVDEIARRLKEGICTVNGLVKPKVVRIGVLDSVNTNVRDLLLDRQVEQAINPSSSPVHLDDDSNSNNKSNKNSDDNKSAMEDNDDQGNDYWKLSMKKDKIRENIRTLQLEIKEIDQDSGNKTRNTKFWKRRKLFCKQLERFRTMLKDVTQEQHEFTNICRLRTKKSIMQNCDIVCATLNGSGHQILFDMNMAFDTVIVDEAAQAVEVSTLIPLKYDCKRCVLVGDPNQLPPTVISQFASKFDYEQSLFVRMEKNTPDNVYLLSIQYRMHPVISAYPSRLFYQSKLLDGPNMEKKTTAVWHRDHLFKPFMFFDIIGSQEQQGRGSSLYNSLEAEAAVALVDKLASNYPNLKLAYKIGIIAPYKDQVNHLKLRFERHFGNKITDVIDFNTVDGFQGQEKDIIIFSCVRASSESGYSIGFLSDVRRMNVGLTRAKKSLFVLGNAETLLVNRFWKALVEDSENRHLLYKCHPPFFRRQLIPGQYPKNVFEAEPGVLQNEIPSQLQRNSYGAPPIASSSTKMDVTTIETATKPAFLWQHPPHSKTTNIYIPKTKQKKSINASNSKKKIG